MSHDHEFTHASDPHRETPHGQTVRTTIDLFQTQTEDDPLLPDRYSGAITEDLIDGDDREADFDLQFRSCINAMAQDDAVGRTWVVFREGAELHMHHIATLDLLGADLTRYEMILFDGGNIHGDLWKHLFFPRQKLHHFVYET